LIVLLLGLGAPRDALAVFDVATHVHVARRRGRLPRRAVGPGVSRETGVSCRGPIDVDDALLELCIELSQHHSLMSVALWATLCGLVARIRTRRCCLPVWFPQPCDRMSSLLENHAFRRRRARTPDRIFHDGELLFALSVFCGRCKSEVTPFFQNGVVYDLVRIFPKPHSRDRDDGTIDDRLQHASHNGFIIRRIIIFLFVVFFACLDKHLRLILRRHRRVRTGLCKNTSVRIYTFRHT
jgi:hypothetical protein